MADALEGCLAALRGTRPLPEVVQTMLAWLDGELSATEASLLQDVVDTERAIQAARAEIAAINPRTLTGREIPSATDELDAIAVHTAAATDAILAACEELEAGAGAAAPAVQAALTRIYEACSFQDITGQRVARVVALLRVIDAKLARIARAFGTPLDPRPAALASGPQLPGCAMRQDDVDALLASLE